MASSSLKRKAADALASSTTASSNNNKTSKTTHNASITSFFGGPKTVVSSKSASTTGTSAPSDGSISSGAAPKFDKQKWVSTLSAETKALLKLEIETLDDSYLSVREIREEVTSKEFLDLKRFLKKEIEVEKKKVFPPLGEVYSWSRHTPLHTVKAVVLGQDPYHNYNQAHGLCFSVRPPTPPPPSLVNIYKALKNDYPSFEPPPKPNNGLLTPWAERGVLLLNTCLTVRAHEANSHSGKGWERFTQKIIDVVAKSRTRGVVFLAWGSPAARRVAKIDRQRHKILQAVHPSPLAAHKGFFECGHFKKANEWLEQRYTVDGIIDWNLGGKVAPISKVETTGIVTQKEENKENLPNGKSVNGSSVAAKEGAHRNGNLNPEDEDEDAIDALNEVAALADGAKESITEAADEIQLQGAEKEADENKPSKVLDGEEAKIVTTDENIDSADAPSINAQQEKEEDEN